MTLRKTRKARKLTQTALADLTGIDQTTISKLELGTMQTPSWPIVAKLAHALKVKPESLFPIEVGK